MSKVTTTVSGESYTYEILWSCCQRQLEAGKNEEINSKYFYLAAMTMAYFTYEAYLNHALNCVAPDIYENERTFFTTPAYYGTPGKLKKLCELVDIVFPETGERPYQSLKLLQQLRDYVAHGKPDPFDVAVKHPLGRNPSKIVSRFDEMVTPKNAGKCVDDVKELITSLNASLISKYGAGCLMRGVLSGFLGYSVADFASEKL